MNLLFDLDGTLTDPREGITKSIRFALEKMSAHIPTEEELQVLIGPPLRQSFAMLLNTEESSLIEKTLGFYRERYSSRGIFENEVYEDVPKMLETLRAEGSHKIFVATSKPRVFAEQIIAHFKFDRFFDKVYGSELDGRLDDKANLIRHIIATESLSTNETVMIGDRMHDIIGAKKNNCRSIGVMYGYGTEIELREAKADFICYKPNEIASVFNHFD